MRLKMVDGGHFLPEEHPELVAQEAREALRPPRG
jgi:surfactin synthase thioesterase subunit